jgi:hypothetical protein
MAKVLAKDSLKMAFVEGNEKVQALAPDGSDQPGLSLLPPESQ